MYYILASHGEYAKACKKSCEMITGDAPQFYVVTFTEDMTKESVEQAYKKILEEHGAGECQAIITDVPGGTPYNAAAPVIHENKNIALVSGLCLGMLIALNTGDTLASAMEQAKETIIGEGIKTDAAKAKEEKKAVSSEPVENNGIVNFRLDERLIHGQVATYWTRTLGATRIMVVGDEIVKDEIAKDALKAAVPAGLKLSVLTVENAAKRLNEGIYAGQRVFLIVNSPDSIVRLLDYGVKVKEVNIGNMGLKDGRKQVKKSVYCTDEEIQTLLSAEKKGVTVFAQMVPNDEKKRFASYINA
ncbi:PTS mannose/fructose/sorbose transporter subunit IIAB [Luxibacter massiliensis]|uniref:PTS mannose/fructose/sorbose transporter subunit IIAB n=1 Tax=Luxibacter massiliensis TaxID=2219695 RepID=UPI000F04A1E9|nr:PTS mannose/fructose/sorbose transporter subunit IIAB [Luxibacter massiliensis]